jgi:hypothetical protein
MAVNQNPKLRKGEIMNRGAGRRRRQRTCSSRSIWVGLLVATGSESISIGAAVVWPLNPRHWARGLRGEKRRERERRRKGEGERTLGFTGARGLGARHRERG